LGESETVEGAEEKRRQNQKRKHGQKSKEIDLYEPKNRHKSFSRKTSSLSCTWITFAAAKHSSSTMGDSFWYQAQENIMKDVQKPNQGQRNLNPR
jgi:hypothetical protein